jgi:hypothetical protein
MLDCGDPHEYCPRELAVHVSSHHFNREPGYNENNAGLGLKWRKPTRTVFVTLGTFRNSLDRDSVYTGTGADWRIGGPVRLRVTAGFVSGYEIPVAPFVFPELLLGDKTGVAFGYTPRVQLGEQVVDSFVSLSIFSRF